MKTVQCVLLLSLLTVAACSGDDLQESPSTLDAALTADSTADASRVNDASRTLDGARTADASRADASLPIVPDATSLTDADASLPTVPDAASAIDGDASLPLVPDATTEGDAMDSASSAETGPDAGEAPVDLGAASTYAILAFNTVTNVNNPGTIVTGDLGISPGAALVGFPPGQEIGTIHAGDPMAAAAKAALLVAYDDAAGRLGPAVLPGDVSGLTFAPGLYKNSTSVMLSAGNLTLDAKGNGNAVFIFQMGSTLTTSAGTQVILSGGAKATNIYWAVGTSATLGTSSIFKGTILAASAITMTTGASIEGRLLAEGAAVSLDTNAITVPAP